MIEAHNINEHAQAPALHLALAASQALAAAGRAESDAATLRRRLRFCRRRGLTPPAGYFKVHLPPAEHAAMLAASRRAMALDAASAPHTHNVSTSDGSALADDPHHPAYAGPSSAALPIAPAMAEVLRVLLLPEARFEALRSATRAAARPGAAAGKSVDVPAAAAAGPGDVVLVADALKRLAGIMLRRYPEGLKADEARLAAAAAPGGDPLPPRLHAALLARIPEQRCLKRLRAWTGTPAAAAALAAAPATAWAAATAAARAAAEAAAAAESSGSEGEEEEDDGEGQEEDEEEEEEQACARNGGGGGGGARKRPRGGGPPAPAAAAEPFSFNFKV